ncbi:MAG: MerR family DNA-binding transcriptional regulator [Methanobacteriota archaeon]|nr:MAG: MerR family DNA-binding transcriptional regulator [Euryarchaeota archaeon]
MHSSRPNYVYWDWNASRLLGVSVTTIRRWDRSMKFPADSRTKRNHRRYLFSRF